MPINWGTSDDTPWGKLKSLAATLAIPAGVALAPVVARQLGIEADPATTVGMVSTSMFALAAGWSGTAAGLQQNVKANDLVEQRKAEESEANRLANHDIAKAIGKTMATIILAYADSKAENSPWRALVDDYDATWIKIAETAPLDRLGMLQDAKILGAIKSNPDAPAFSATEDKAFWEDIVAIMASHAKVDPAALAAQPEYAAIIDALDTRFCYEFYQVLKQDATDGGRAYPGIILRGMGLALVYLERIDNRQVREAERQDRVIEMLHNVIDKLAAKEAGNSVGNYAVFRTWLKVINYNIEALNANTDALRASEVATGDLTQALKENTAAHRGKTASWPPDNLTVVSVPNNAAKFKGRIDELAELHRRVMTDPAGLPIPVIALPGLGKSALVTRYVYLHQADFDHVWWVRASNPKGNTPGSAEERSLAALLDLWGIDSKAVQGDAHTSRVEALAAEVRASLSRPKADGSRARHLLVLDNVDDYATVKRLRLNAPSRVIFTGRATHLARDGAMAMELGALSPEDGVLMLRAKTNKWNGDAHAATLIDMGKLVGWNALALVYLSAVLARPSTQSPIGLRDVLAGALAAGSTGPLSTPRDHERPDDHDQKVEEAFTLFIAPYADTREMALLDTAALCAPEDIAVDLLRDASGLNADNFCAALDELVSAGVLDLDEGSLNIHQLTQMSVRGHMTRRGVDAKAGALRRLRRALIRIYRWPADWRRHFNDHTKTGIRMACWAHAEVVIAASPPSAERALLCARLAFRLKDAGQFDAAARYIDAAFHWAESTPRVRGKGVHWIYASRASIRHLRGLLKQAEEDIARSIAWGVAQSPRDERSLAIWFAARADIRQQLGHFKEAEDDIANAIARGVAQSPRDERSIAAAYSCRAKIRQNRGLLKEADMDLAKAIAWFDAQSPRDERGLAVLLASRASIRQNSGDLAGAEADIKKSIAWFEAQFPRDERTLAISFALRARIHQQLGRLQEAEECIANSIAWLETQSPRDEHSLAAFYATRASISQDRGLLKDAYDDITKSIAWEEAQPLPNQRELAIRYALRATILQSEAIAARWGGARAKANSLFSKAKTDIAAALDWFETNMPTDQRTIIFFRERQTQIKRAARGV